jgi:hypothetical protein
LVALLVVLIILLVVVPARVVVAAALRICVGRPSGSVVSVINAEISVILHHQFIRSLPLVPGVGRPGRLVISVIDDEISVSLHGQFVRSCSFSSGVACPHGELRLEVGTVVNDEVSVILDPGMIKSILGGDISVLLETCIVAESVEELSGVRTYLVCDLIVKASVDVISEVSVWVDCVACGTKVEVAWETTVRSLEFLCSAAVACWEAS